MRFKQSSSDNKLLRHGRFFDKIFYLPGKRKARYQEGDFCEELKQNPELNDSFTEFLNEIKSELNNRRLIFK